MSAPAQNKPKLLKDRTERLLQRALVREEARDFIRRLMDRGELALIGGAIRDAYLEGIKEFQSDLDFVIHPRSLTDFTSLMTEYGANANRFGGYRLQIDRWKIDVWPLQLTWARVAGHCRVENFEDLLGVTFFDWDSVVFNLCTRKTIYSATYFDRIAARVLDINLLPNPNPLGNAVRALRYARRWQASFGPELAAHVYRMMREHGEREFLEAEKNSFQSTLLNSMLFSAGFDELKHASETRLPSPVYPFASIPSEQLALPTLEDVVATGNEETTPRQPPYDARAIANFLLDLADRQNVHLTQVSLLKLIYFAHGWYLVKSGKRLIKQDFEAWQYGPVVKVVRDEFKEFAKEPIRSRAHRLDIYSGRRTLVDAALERDDEAFVTSIFDAYHVYDAWHLSDMTHEEGSPWDQIWNSTRPVGRLALRIRDDDIKKHFDRLTKRLPMS